MEKTLFEEVLDEGLKERCKRVKMGCLSSFQSTIDSLRDKGLTVTEFINELEEYIVSEKKHIDSEYMRFRF